MKHKQDAKRRNPLRRRVLRELLGDGSKYLVVFLFLTLMIGIISGVYVANGSMSQSLSRATADYAAEDGHFHMTKRLGAEVMEKIEKGEVPTAEGEEKKEARPIRLYETVYREVAEVSANHRSDVRVYLREDRINRACLMAGDFPEGEQEIAIDRMHADNCGIAVGDQIEVGGQMFRVSGLIAYVNYSTLHRKNTDFMFDAITFDVAMMDEAGFARLSQSPVYQYVWQYVDPPQGDRAEKEAGEDLVKTILAETLPLGIHMVEFVPRIANQAMTFAPDDLGQDQAMAGVLLYILVTVIAFIFSLTISTTITKEAAVIGTLRASGYTKAELIRHFCAMPMIVTVLAAIAGNVLGYTFFKDRIISLYYNSYSLPTYQTLWNAKAFLSTTVVPLILMLVINILMMWRKLSLSPLRFLRRDLRRQRSKKAMRLPRFSFLSRFRLRIILDHIPNFVVLTLGILFVMVMLAMATGMPETLRFYQKQAPNLVVAPYQYVLNSMTDERGQPIQTREESAEPFAMTETILQDREREETIWLYGLEANSRYLTLPDLSAQEAVVSYSLAEKYGIGVGDEVVVKERFADREYRLTVRAVKDRSPSLAIFIPIEAYRELMGLDREAFSGYLSERALTDIDEERVAAVIGKKDVTAAAAQLDHSMGSYMLYFQYSCIGLSAVLLYLLTKVIIEKNQSAISMAKILGYTDREIGGLYIRATTIVVVVATVATAFAAGEMMRLLWLRIMMRMDGYFTFHMTGTAYLRMMIFTLLGYFLVMLIDVRRIRRIPLEEALKNAE